MEEKIINKTGNTKKEVKIKSVEKITKRITFALLSLIIATVLFLLSFYTKTAVSLPYYEKSNVDYAVFLKENDYYDTPSLVKGMQYIAALIDYIDVKFDYSFKVDDKIDYTYKYYIEAYTKVCDKNNKENIIYDSKTTLLEKTVKSKEASYSFNINENLKIKYSDYNDLVRNFKSSYNINADSSLTLTMYVELVGDYYKFKEPSETKNSIELTIPLSEQMINIKMDQKDIDNISRFEETSNRELFNNIFLIASGAFAVLFLISALNLLVVTKKIKGKKVFTRKKYIAF